MVASLIGNTYLYLLVMVRLAGMIGFNPLLSRRNVPAMMRTGIIFMMTLIVAPTVSMNPAITGSVDLVMAILKELFIGFICGFVFETFYYMLFFVGDLMDVQFGMSMAKVFDPGTSIQMSISGNIISLIFVLYVLATDSHLVLIHMFATSFEIIGLGQGVFLESDIAMHMLQLIIGVFSLAIRLAIPFVAAEFILELSMGILMKLIPQIHVFVINIQFKMLLGITLLLLFASPIASFVDNYMRIMLTQIEEVLMLMA